ncbi:MAG: TonB-dependent receptor [Bacteroidales bacterium]|jgi:TonB-linked SusC/RagA family outer membrane protein|nr:TonB-dependent receptor [Bacteroidales bacterium]MCI1786248.1 TonB-dependent receptor [Bacteroidales bacterium]
MNDIRKAMIVAGVFVFFSVTLFARDFSIKMNNVTVRQAITELESQSGYLFVFASQDLNTARIVSIDADKLTEAVNQITKGQDVTYEIIKNYIIVKSSSGTSVSSVQKNQIVISGTVKDKTGNPVAGADVVIKVQARGTSTDSEGKFNLAVSPGDVITISCLGYIPQDITVQGDKTVFDIVLADDTKTLEEVVVIGYGTVRKSDLTGSLSQVNDKAFKDQNVTGIDQVLQGRAAGVQVSSTVGAPGGDVRIRVRGSNSILGDNSPLFVIDGLVGGDYSLINPNDVQSIEVLKDASSTAIYGSRGANGVIIVTTKSGNTDGKVNITYSGNVSVSSILKKYDLMNAGDFATYVNKHDEAMGLSSVTFTDAEIQKYYENGGFDYQDAVFHQSVSTQHQVSVSGGNNKTRFRVSGNYLNDNGIVRNTDYTRFSFRANINTNINDKLSFRFLVNGASSKGKNNEARTGAGNPIVQMLSWAPTTNPYDENGGYTISDPVGSIKTNPLSLIYNSENIYEKTNINVLGGITYEVIPGLKADFQAVGDVTFNTDKTWSGKYASSNNPNASKEDGQSHMYQTTSQLTYDKSFGNHHLNATAVFETQQYKWSDLYGSASGLKFSELKYDNLAQATSTSVSTDYSAWQLLSYLGRVNYSFKDRYLLTASVRRDGSSKFAKGNRYSVFPAAAIAWNAGKENFIKDLGLFSKLKLRLSWGVTGSQAISPYATLSGYNTSIYYAFDTGERTNGIQMDNPGNLDLKWETTTQKDLGLEFGLFEDRLDVDIDVYKKDTKDLLLNKSVPYYIGGGSITSNVGKLENKGVDVNVSADIISNEDWNWNTSINYSFVRNRVTDLGDENEIFDNADVSGWNGQPEFVYKVGHSLGSLWGLKYLGPWKKSEAAEAAKYGCVPGDAHYYDKDNNYSIDGSDYQIVGVAIPTQTLGWNNTVTYKNFTLNAFFQGVFGIHKFDYTRCMALCASRDAKAATLEEAKKVYVAGENENTWLPSWSPTSLWVPASTLFLEDASYLRLKNLSLSYSFKVRNVGDFKTTLSATNLLTFTNYKGIDPESSNVGGGGSDIRQGIDYGSYPNARTYTLGLNITF